MNPKRVLVIGSGHLAFRLKKLLAAQQVEITYLAGELFKLENGDNFTSKVIAEILKDIDLSSFHMTYVVDDLDERNLGLLIALISLNKDLPICVSLFNENIAPHLRAAHPNTRILNPAKIAAPTFIDSLQTSVKRVLRYTPVRLPNEPKNRRSDNFIVLLVAAFSALIFSATAYFHYAESLSWVNSFYFVFMTLTTVGYGDINLLHASAMSKLLAVALVLTSTFFIWMIFSLTIDFVLNKRAQLSLGRKKYRYTGHIILCGLGRLGYFIAEGLLDRGERVVIIEQNENSARVEHFRNRGADVYIGNARLPRVLKDVGVDRAEAVYSVINNDYANLEIGLNARSFVPDIRLILRIFDEAMSQKIKDNLDIRLTHSMTAIADDAFSKALTLSGTATA